MTLDSGSLDSVTLKRGSPEGVPLWFRVDFAFDIFTLVHSARVATASRFYLILKCLLVCNCLCIDVG
jgi:hypothetical protein